MAGVHAHDALGLAQDDLDDARVLALGRGGRELPRERRRRDRAQVDEAAFRLRDDLLADDEDVAIGAGRWRRVDGAEQQGGEVVARLDHRDAGDRQDRQRRGPIFHHKDTRTQRDASSATRPATAAPAASGSASGLCAARAHRSTARASRRDCAGERMIVSVTSGPHAERGDPRRQVGVALVEDEQVDEVAVELGDADRRHLVAEARAACGRAAP